MLAALTLATIFLTPSNSGACVIYRDGAFAGVGYEFSGGQRLAQPLLAGALKSVQLPLTLRFTPMNNIGIFQEAMAFINGADSVPHKYEWTRPDNAISEHLTFQSSVITEIGFPAMDVDARQAAFFTIGFQCDNPNLIGPANTTADEKQHVKAQKQWLPCNFRLSIPGMPTQRVSKIDSFTMKYKAADFDGDGKPDYGTTEDIGFVIPFADAAPFRDWLAKVANGTPTPMPMTIEYRDPNDQALITISTSVQISSLGFDDLMASDNALPNANKEVKVKVTTVNSAKGINSPNILISHDTSIVR